MSSVVGSEGVSGDSDRLGGNGAGLSHGLSCPWSEIWSIFFFLSVFLNWCILILHNSRI